MQRDRRPRSPGFFGSSDWMRLLAMIGALLVLGMLIVRLRDPDTHRAMEELLNPNAQGQVQQAAQTAAPPISPAVAESKADSALENTDLDPEQWEEARREFQAISDRKEQIQREEMVPYNRMVRWSLNQTTAQMRSRAATDLRYNDFVQSPDKCRGKLVDLVLDARMIIKAGGPPEYPVRLYEVWGTTMTSGAWMHVAVVVNLPDGMPVGERVNEQIRVVGYFFKLQGYKSALARAGDRPEIAPMFIGRMVWIQQPGEADAGKQAAAEPEAFWQTSAGRWLTAGALVALAVAAIFIPFLRRKRPKRSLLELRAVSRPDALPSGLWEDEASAPKRLDHVEARQDNDE